MKKTKDALEPDKVRRRVASLKRGSMLELNNEHYLSTHNLRIQSGLSLKACRPIDVEPYLPAYAASW